MEIIRSFDGLPESLLKVMPQADLPGQGCSSDSTDCVLDGYCAADSSDCSTDGGACTRDGCTDCSDCDDTPEPEPEPTSISIVSTSSTEDSITLVCSVHTQWGGTVWVQAAAGGKTGTSSRATMTAGQTRSFTVTITGLSPGTGYTVTAQLNSTELSGIVSTSTVVYTEEPVTPTSIEITSTSSTYNSITATAQFHVQYGGSGIYVQLWVSGRTVNSAYYTMSANSDKTVTLTVTGLSADTQYEVIAFLRTTAMDPSPVAESQSLGVWTEQLPVEPWTWTGSNGQATATQTRNAYSILQGNRTADDFSHNVWNDLIDKVVEMRQALGYSWTTDTGRFPSASGCKVSAGEALSALKYNAMRTNVGSIRSTGIPDVSAGDEITGYMIVHVTDVLNDIIADM